MMELHRLLGELQATLRAHVEEGRVRSRRIVEMQAQMADLRAEMRADLAMRGALSRRLERVETIAEDYRQLKQRGWGAILGAAIAGAGASMGVAGLWQRFVIGH